MNRLKKLALNEYEQIDNQNLVYIQTSLDQVSKQGRSILKDLEEFKFFIEQTAKILKNNEKIMQAVINKKSIVDEMSNKLYGIVFDLENMDITNSFFDNTIPTPQIVPDEEKKEKEDKEKEDKEKEDKEDKEENKDDKKEDKKEDK